jgi:hypothetical protein
MDNYKPMARVTMNRLRCGPPKCQAVTSTDTATGRAKAVGLGQDLRPKNQPTGVETWMLWHAIQVLWVFNPAPAGLQTTKPGLQTIKSEFRLLLVHLSVEYLVHTAFTPRLLMVEAPSPASRASAQVPVGGRWTGLTLWDLKCIFYLFIFVGRKPKSQFTDQWALDWEKPGLFFEPDPCPGLPGPAGAPESRKSTDKSGDGFDPPESHV